MAQSSTLNFIENKGQWNDNVKFQGDLNNGAFFLTAKGFTVLQHKADDMQQLRDSHHPKIQSEIPSSNTITLHSHAYEVTFLNASTPTIISNEAISSYNNYFIGNDPSKWAGNCKIYQEIIYKNIYPGIDVKYYSANNKIKYDLIVNPGADVSKIAMRYKGADALEIDNGHLVIKTSVGNVTELPPYTYQQFGSVTKQVACGYI